MGLHQKTGMEIENRLLELTGTGFVSHLHMHTLNLQMCVCVCVCLCIPASTLQHYK